jgi:NAD(P)-dependent dehydrogenase (short-subunit alcohol dehydrogenase family)
VAILKNRIALITGASRGIGAAVAVRFAKEGAHVICCGRDVKGLEETDDLIRAVGGAATLVEIDLTDSAKIELLAQTIAARFGRLDILVGNAGQLGELSPMAHLCPNVWQKTLDINLTANWQLIRWFDPLLKLSDCPRAMFVTSGVAQGARAYWGVYAVSKAALESMVRIYAAENEQTPLRANLVSPGEVRTRMHAQAFPGADPDDYPLPEAVTDIFVTLASPELKETGRVFRAQ